MPVPRLTGPADNNTPTDNVWRWTQRRLFDLDRLDWYRALQFEDWVLMAATDDTNRLGLWLAGSTLKPVAYLGSMTGDELLDARRE